MITGVHEGEREIEFGFGPYYPAMTKIDNASLSRSDLTGLKTEQGSIGSIDFGIWQRIEAGLMPPELPFWRRATDFVVNEVIPVLKNPASLRAVLMGNEQNPQIKQTPA